MPVRSLNSAVLKWPDAETSLRAARSWAVELAARDGNVRRVLLFGSLARNDWGVGSDIDLLVEVDSCEKSFIARGGLYDASSLPAPADVTVYTADEILSMHREGRRFIKVVESGSLELYRR